MVRSVSREEGLPRGGCSLSQRASPVCIGRDFLHAYVSVLVQTLVHLQRKSGRFGRPWRKGDDSLCSRHRSMILPLHASSGACVCVHPVQSVRSREVGVRDGVYSQQLEQKRDSRRRDETCIIVALEAWGR